MVYEPLVDRWFSERDVYLEPTAEEIQIEPTNCSGSFTRVSEPVSSDDLMSEFLVEFLRSESSWITGEFGEVGELGDDLSVIPVELGSMKYELCLGSPDDVSSDLWAVTELFGVGATTELSGRRVQVTVHQLQNVSVDRYQDGLLYLREPRSSFRDKMWMWIRN
jgi:hypothetical protein